MTLEEHIAARIRANGPISIADYMAECLFHPQWGYYTTKEPFGVSGDFTTSPEISQMFGELIGLAFAQAWMDQSRPERITLAELGPGRGTLMADMLRAAGQVPGFLEAADIVLVEASPRLRALQNEKLSAYDVKWLEDVQDLPDQTLFLVANEFFDALPVRQFVRQEKMWRERQVGIAEGILSIGLAPEAPQPVLSHRLDDTATGDIVEIAPQTAPICDRISQIISEYGGIAYLIDYGDWRSLGDTLQAVQKHDFVPLLQFPGHSDLSAHVDFEALTEAARCAVSKLTPQGIFLERLGITARAQALAAKLSGTALDNHIAAHRRLTHPDEMGNLFKVLGLYPAGMPPPPGLDA